MTTDNFCVYLQNRLIQTSQTGGQQYSDTSLLSIPCSSLFVCRVSDDEEKSFIASKTDLPFSARLKRLRLEVRDGQR